MVLFIYFLGDFYSGTSSPVIITAQTSFVFFTCDEFLWKTGNRQEDFLYLEVLYLSSLLPVHLSSPQKDVDILPSWMSCIGIILPWLPEKNMASIHINHFVNNHILVRFVNRN